MTELSEPTLFDLMPLSEQPVVAQIPFGVALLALSRVNGLGQTGLQRLVKHHGENLGQVLQISGPDLAEHLHNLNIKDATKIADIIAKEDRALIKHGNETLRALEIRGITVVSPTGIPERLKSINGDAPSWLFVQGHTDLLIQRPIVALVGTRKPSEEGIRASDVITKILSIYPVVVVSGLAEGIDARSHDYSLRYKLKNIAFLGHGINLVFPRVTASIRERIIKDGGAVVSEYLPQQSYQKQQFVERNRLQAALADIVIPIEAATSSGTAHTVRFARRYGRKLIGIRWPGNNGIVEDQERQGDQIIDIFTSEGQKQLDQILQTLVASKLPHPYPLQNLEDYVLAESRPSSVTCFAPNGAARVSTISTAPFSARGMGTMRKAYR